MSARGAKPLQLYPTKEIRWVSGELRNNKKIARNRSNFYYWIKERDLPQSHREYREENGECDKVLHILENTGFINSLIRHEIPEITN